MTVVTPTDRPKSVRYRCVINLLSELFVSLLCFNGNSAGIRRVSCDLGRSLHFLFHFPLVALVGLWVLLDIG